MPRRLFTFVSLLGLLVFLVVVSGCGQPSTSDTIQRAQKQIDAGRTPQAIERLEKALTATPNDNRLREALAFAHLSGGNASRAGDLFKELGLGASPDSHLYAAEAYKKANEPEKAIEAYRLYLLTEPRQSTPWVELGELLIAQGRTAEGLSCMAKANDVAPSPELALKIAQSYAKVGNAPQAERYLQNALRQAKAAQVVGSGPAPISADILVELTQLALSQKKSMEAQRHLRQLERDFPKNEKLSELKNKLANPGLNDKDKSKGKETEKGKSDSNKKEPKALSPVIALVAEVISPTPAPPPPPDPLVEALSLDSQNADRWITLGAFKAKAGDYAWAEAAYLEAMRLRPSSGAIIVAYLEVVKKRRSPSEYLDECERQLTKYPEIAELYIITGRGYRDLMQNKRNARQLFGKFLKKFPTHPDARIVKSELDALK